MAAVTWLLLGIGMGHRCMHNMALGLGLKFGLATTTRADPMHDLGKTQTC